MFKSLSELTKAVDDQKRLLAQLTMEVNQLIAAKEKLSEEYEAAITSANQEQAGNIVRRIAEINAEMQLKGDIIGRIQGKLPFKNADCIEVANAESAPGIAELEKLSVKYRKMEKDLAMCIHDMAELYDKTRKTRAQCLVYHSAYGKAASETHFLNEGLKPMPEMPEIGRVNNILFKYYPNEAEIIRNTFNTTI